MNAQEVQARMNESGKKRIPFLFAVDFERENGLFIENPLAQTDILFRTPSGGNQPESILASGAQPPEMASTPIPYSAYKRRFDIVMQGLRRGDSYLANLTVRTPVQTALSLKDIFLFCHSPYGLFVPNCFTCFSPERFANLSNGIIAANPMKGTISADIPDAEARILSNPKEIAEHCTIVDLMRNDMGMVAEAIRVERFRYIDRIRSFTGDILQVSSEIIGRLPDDYRSRLGDIIFRMLPAGSVSGAPKKSTVAIIQKAEAEPRGYYTGVFGYFDGDALDSAVLIRFIAQDEGQLFFHSGGGITVNSHPESEYEEVLRKVCLPCR
jgi:para-aminobenzoate synthetase component 1